MAEDGTVQGLSVDYLRAIARETGLQVSYLAPAPLDRNLALARARDADLLSSLRPTPERSQYLAFTQPYVSIPAVVVVRAAYRGGADLQALAGHTVAVGRSYAVEGYVRQRYPAVRWVAVPDDAEGLAGVHDGRFDAAVADVASVRFIARHHRLESLRVGEPVGFEYALSFAYRRDWPELGAILDRGLRRLSAAERQEMHIRWVEPYRDADSDGDRTVLVVLGGGCIALAIVVAPLARRKRRKPE
jgi:ABC-type amino acid transport substrate-binding protein